MTADGESVLYPEMVRTATISDDGLYRYDLTRRWGEGPVVLWIMLNPSTADGLQDDPTIRRCIGFTKAWGWNGLAVVNRYAFRSADPKALLSAKNPMGPENAAYWRKWFDQAVFAVAAWGAWKPPKGLPPWGVDLSWCNPMHFAGRSNTPLYCLGTTKDGAPRHPLYVAAKQQREPWPLTAVGSEGPS